MEANSGVAMVQSISYIDFIIGGGLLLFIIIGVVRGFTNDILSLFTWLGAILLTKEIFPHLQPIMRRYIIEPFFSDVVLGFFIFIVSLIILVFLAKQMSNIVQKSALSGVDRTLGIFSGGFRAAVILTGVYLGVLLFYKPGQAPEAMTNSRLLPAVHHTSQLAYSYVIPKDFFPKRLVQHLFGKDKVVQDTLVMAPEDLVESLSSPKAGPKSSPEKTVDPVTKGYKKIERKALENLIDQISPEDISSGETL